jgi:hypothetical protein
MEGVPWVNVLVDKHHADLFHSLQILFEDKLGHLVFTPIGHDWWGEGYWRFGQGYGDDRLARQFLEAEPIADHHHPDRPIRYVTLEQARGMDWAFVVATVQDNQRGFKRLADEIGARYVLQVGNTNQYVDWSLDPLAIVSSEVPIQGRGVVVHQPMPKVFKYRKPKPTRTIRSFVNCFNSTPCIAPFVSIGYQLPEFTFHTHGIDGSDGNVETVREIADLMAGSLFGWHDKVQGDGFGHVIHDWAAVGRPIIGHASHYRGLMGERFWRDGETAIDLDKHSIPEVAETVREIAADPKRHRAMCEAIRAEFDRIDWDGETEAVRGLLA